MALPALFRCGFEVCCSDGEGRPLRLRHTGTAHLRCREGHAGGSLTSPPGSPGRRSWLLLPPRFLQRRGGREGRLIAGRPSRVPLAQWGPYNPCEPPALPPAPAGARMGAVFLLKILRGAFGGPFPQPKL